jgi:predicted transposase/invertase (TIGR01784 family)
MRLIFIELPKFCPQDAPAQDLLTGWLAFLKDPVGMDRTYMDVQEVKEAMNTLKYISSDKKLREAALLRQREINDRHSEMTVAIQRGMAIGEARGEARGKAIGEARGKAIGEARGKAMGKAIGEAEIKTKIAISMLEKGLSLETISDYTGMSVHEINTIQKYGKLGAEM